MITIHSCQTLVASSRLKMSNHNCATLQNTQKSKSKNKPLRHNFMIKILNSIKSSKLLIVHAHNNCCMHKVFPNVPVVIKMFSCPTQERELIIAKKHIFCCFDRTHYRFAADSAVEHTAVQWLAPPPPLKHIHKCLVAASLPVTQAPISCTRTRT